MQEIIECACGCGGTFEKYDKYGRARKYKVGHGKIKKSLADAYESFVIKNDGCWGWDGALSCGYGSFRYRQKHYHAHRVSYEIHNGAIPDGNHVIHTCDNKLCTNPKHLKIGTHTDNMHDYIQKFCEGRAVISDKQVSDIRSLKGKMSYKEISEATGVKRSSVSRIANMKRRRDVPVV